MRTPLRVFDLLITLMAWMAALLLLTLMLATVAKVGLRATTGYGLLGIDQLSGLIMVWMTFLGAPWVLREGGHVVVDLLILNLRGRSAQVFAVVAALLGAIVCLTIAWFGLQAVLTSLRRGILVAAELEIPRAVNIAPIPLGMLFLGLEFLRRAATALSGGTVVTQGEGH